MILECSAFTLKRDIVIGFKPITVMKGCVPLDLRCEMIVMPLDRVLGCDNFSPTKFENPTWVFSCVFA